MLASRVYSFSLIKGNLLAFVTHDWNRSLKFHGKSLVNAVCISKAFDKGWHVEHLHKVPSHGIPSKLSTWVSSYVSGKWISVVVNGYSSSLYPIKAGVSQVLAPTLFLQNINDLFSSISNSINSYAVGRTPHTRFQLPMLPSNLELNNNRRTLSTLLSKDLVTILDPITIILWLWNTMS